MKTMEITDARVAKAYAHPLRIHILGMLDNATMSPSEIADALDAPLTHVSYHVRQLHSLGLIRLVRTTPRRGAVEHHYTAVARARVDGGWDKLPRAVKHSLTAGSVERLGAHVSDGLTEGGFERDGAQLTETTLTLDERGWSAVGAELERAARRLEQIREASAKRLGEDDGIKATVALLLFEGPSAAAGLPPDAGIRRHRKRRGS